MSDTIETCRRLYNDSLGERNTDWEIGYWEQQNLLPLRKRENKFYKQVHSQVLQDVIQRLDKAYQSFFSRLSGYPRFKRRDRYNSFTYPQWGGWKILENKLVLSRVGVVTVKIHRIPSGTLKRCTIIRDVDQWYCCITSDEGIEHGTRYDKNKPIGIDVGLINWVTLSDNKKLQNHFDINAHEKRIKRLQRNLSRKKIGSKNRGKARITLAKAWRTVRRCRDDFVHKASRQIADEGYTLVAFEKLKIGHMVKDHHLAKAIMGATWGKLRLYTAYKVEEHGGRVVVVNPNGTSQKCSCCGSAAKEKLDLSVRTFECGSCGLVLDRDVNAARNILKLGLDQAHAETEPLLIRHRISKFQSRKQEANAFRRR